MKPRRSILRVFGPGLLVAATGVGAGDLATGAFTGSQLGVAVAWAALLGALLKFTVSEGLTRWQIATGQSVLEGALLRFGRPLREIFLIYLLAWSWFVGCALVSGCGVATHALIPVFDPATGKLVFGILASVLGLVLVLCGGFALFEKCMRVCIIFMFGTVIVTAGLLVEDWSAVLSGLVVPTIPDAGGKGVIWTMALMGGIGGTLTIICYGYWIREADRDGPDDLSLCRIDLAIGYGVTGLFGVAMVILGSGLELAGKQDAAFVVNLADHLEGSLGPVARWMFLVGTWGAFFSSLLGVWQAVPYVFADFLRITSRTPPAQRQPVDTGGRPYRGFLFALTFAPLVGLWLPFRDIQKFYAVLGALFLPMLALTLLMLNNRVEWVGERHRNRWLGNLSLVIVLLFFLVLEFLRRLPGP